MPRDNRPVGAIGALLLAGVISAGLLDIGGCPETDDTRRPAIVYFVNGKPVFERRFRTDGEREAYLNSDIGKREAAYFSRQNGGR